jgi:hypothetical protein
MSKWQNQFWWLRFKSVQVFGKSVQVFGKRVQVFGKIVQFQLQFVPFQLLNVLYFRKECSQQTECGKIPSINLLNFIRSSTPLYYVAHVLHHYNTKHQFFTPVKSNRHVSNYNGWPWTGHERHNRLKKVTIAYNRKAQIKKKLGGAISKLWAPEGWYKPSSTLKTHRYQTPS